MIGQIAQSPELAQFYKDLQSWIDSDFELNSWLFTHGSGICHNLINWLNFHYIRHLRREFTLELVEQFTGAGLDERYPFNVGVFEYQREDGRYTRNTRRLAWIKEHSQ